MELCKQYEEAAKIPSLQILKLIHVLKCSCSFFFSVSLSEQDFIVSIFHYLVCKLKFWCCSTHNTLDLYL